MFCLDLKKKKKMFVIFVCVCVCVDFCVWNFLLGIFFGGFLFLEIFLDFFLGGGGWVGGVWGRDGCVGEGGEGVVVVCACLAFMRLI